MNRFYDLVVGGGESGTNVSLEGTKIKLHI
jgi:hypothetical protein